MCVCACVYKSVWRDNTVPALGCFIMTLKSEESYTKWLEDARTFLFTSWGDCRISLLATGVSILKRGKLFPVPLETKQKLGSFKRTSLSSALSECLIVCVPLPFSSGDKVSLLWSSVQSALHCEKNREWFPTFCLITGCNFLYLL